MDENFIVDFGEVTRVITDDFNKLNNRPSYAGELMTGDTNIPQVPSSVSELNNDSNYQTGTQVSEAIGTETEAREAADTALDGRLTTVEGIAATALQPSSIDKVVMTDINVGANTSTTTFNLDASKQNLLTGATSSKQVSMPVASSTEAGIMNSATFDAVVNNTANINALANGAVAITGLPSSPTQAQLTTAWENATGETSLMNRAGIYDVTNGKVWTYYTNDTTWHSTTNTTQVTINTFTNSSEGTIKGSTNVGQVFAEADGTGSVNGWDALNDAVGNNSSDISNLQTAVDGKQDKLIAGANINIAADGKTISATDTTYTAGNAIDITNGEISADIHPADFFTASDSISDCGSNLILDNTIATTLKSVEVKGNTYQQSYSGKNLLDTSSYAIAGSGLAVTRNQDGSFTVNGTSTNNVQIRFSSTIEFNGDYTVATIGDRSPTNAYINIYERSDYTGNITYFNALLVNHYRNFTTTQTSLSQNINIEPGTYDNFVFRPIIVKGTYNLSNIGDFEPYVGGPSPNPDYPQPINVVTGVQTISITDGTNTQNFTVNLGSIELAKIGSYQDYIYKSGDDWYLHKEIYKKTLNGSESWESWGTSSQNNTRPARLQSTDISPLIVDIANTQSGALLCNGFTDVSQGYLYSNDEEGIATTSSNLYIKINKTTIGGTGTTNDFKNWLTSNNVIVYYALATPTDTKITDATLVAQLNALARGKSYNNQTDIVVTATGGNLPAILCVEAFQKSLNGLLGAIERLGA